MESIRFALAGLGNDKLRTLLSLAGIAIGIFTIIAVLTLVETMERSVDQGLNRFGSDVVFVEQIPLEPDLNDEGEFKWWEYISRPQVSYGEYEYMRDKREKIGEISWSCFLNDGVSVGVSDGWMLSVRNDIRCGRGFTATELENGAAVAIVGADFADAHKGESAVAIDGVRFEIIGEFERSGINAVSMVDVDASVIIPASRARRLWGFAGCRQVITARPADGVSDEEFCDEIRMLMRRWRRLSPLDGDNFSINRLSFIARSMKELFSTLDRIGWIIGIFSLLAGGFGVANIMFVSIRERTGEIGIKKALGARSRDIRRQFLTEAVTLSLLGGLAAVAFGWLVTLLFAGGPLELRLSAKGVAIALALSFITGIAAGVAPATAAAKMNPVDSIRRP